MILLAIAAASACITVEGDQIRAADLARAVPAFASVAPDTALAFSPSPGVRRAMLSGELARLAARHGASLPAAAQGVCFERAAERLTEERVLAALKTALGDGSPAKIELLDFPKQPLARGELEFPRSGFTPPAAASAPAVWRGRLRYSEHRSLPVWARVRITVRGQRVAAAVDLAPGRAIEASQVRVEETDLPPFFEAVALADVVGRAPRRSVRAGEAIRPAQLMAPPVVARGEAVSVEVTSGGAQIKLEAKAETSGRRGEMVMLRNPENGRRFQARVESPGKVTIDAKQNPAMGAAVSGGARRLSR
jgi:flagella basal body P-ring formation protein FlgA